MSITSHLYAVLPLRYRFHVVLLLNAEARVSDLSTFRTEAESNLLSTEPKSESEFSSLIYHNFPFSHTLGSLSDVFSISDLVRAKLAKFEELSERSEIYKVVQKPLSYDARFLRICQLQFENQKPMSISLHCIRNK